MFILSLLGGIFISTGINLITSVSNRIFSGVLFLFLGFFLSWWSYLCETAKEVAKESMSLSGISYSLAIKSILKKRQLWLGICLFGGVVSLLGSIILLIRGK